ncbi:MAG: AMP-binding protein, partial [Planctomycetales bacterium]|nr:AMP-binding protein [Planctomycetales bacterium]
QVCDSDRLLFVTSLSFDLSVYDVFGILAAGGSIRIVTADEIRDPQRLLTILETEPITFWDSAPQALNQLSPLLAQRDGSRAGELRLVFLSGDWIPVSLPTLLQQAFPRVEVVSLGGATEATVWSNFYRIAHVDSQWKSIPYGKPIQNSQYYILDPCRNPCPVGVTGELYIGGDCLANGYTDSNRTAEQFIEHSLAGESRRLYRTGDLARFEADGNIELIGRIDHQVKIRGYRIELGEIESVLRRHKQVDDAVVVVHDSAEGEKRLVAYVVLRHSVATNQQELRAWLRVRLPGYMIPSAFVTLDRLPLNSSGKLDRRALPKPDFRRIDCESQYVAPRSPTEVQLVQVWQRLLGVEPIGVADNFFDLGGHSLLAARMQLEIARSLHRTVPLATLLQSPTVAKLAQAIDREDCVPACQSLAIIQSGAARRPLFCIHVLGRGLKFFRPLVAHLDPSLPVYGLSTQFLVGDVPEHRVEPLADFYVREIRSIQPEGPYSLVGLSFGGLVALEVARRLEAGGQEVGLLVLLDSAHPDSMKKLSLSQRIVDTIQLMWNGHWQTASAKIRDFCVTHREWLGRRITRCRGRFVALLGRELSDDLVDFLHREANRRAARLYRPMPYSGRITYIKAANKLKSCRADELKWSEVARGGMDLHAAPGDHLTMMEEPWVGVVGQIIDACLAQTRGEISQQRVATPTASACNDGDNAANSCR